LVLDVSEFNLFWGEGRLIETYLTSLFFAIG
jgi:hypothetical protein